MATVLMRDGFQPDVFASAMLGAEVDLMNNEASAGVMMNRD